MSSNLAAERLAILLARIFPEAERGAGSGAGAHGTLPFFMRVEITAASRLAPHWMSSISEGLIRSLEMKLSAKFLVFEKFIVDAGGKNPSFAHATAPR